MPSFDLHRTFVPEDALEVSVRAAVDKRGSFDINLECIRDYGTSLGVFGLTEADLVVLVLDCLPHLSPDRLQQVQLGITMRREQMRATACATVSVQASHAHHDWHARGVEGGLLHRDCPGCGAVERYINGEWRE